MSEIIREAAVESVAYGAVKIASLDGFEAMVDFRPVIEDGERFEFLRRAPDRFCDVRLGEYGHTIEWIDDDGEEVDFGSDSLRRRAIRQAEILRSAS